MNRETLEAALLTGLTTLTSDEGPVRVAVMSSDGGVSLNQEAGLAALLADAVLALSSPETTPAGVLALDVERLRKAIDLSGIGIAEGGSLASDWAEAIAEEYDRLGGASQGSILPPITPIPGLNVHSANDLLSPEAKAGLDANLRDIARTQRQALSAAATMPLGSALPATPAGVLDEAALREAAAQVAREHPLTVGGYGVWCGPDFPRVEGACRTYFDGFEPPTCRPKPNQGYGWVHETLTEHLARALAAALGRSGEPE